jgi:hypothetical protein
MGQSNISSRLSRHIYAGQRASWAVALCFAAPITWFYLGLLSYWFAVIDRYRVFLYKHDMGPLAPGRMAAQRPWELFLLLQDGLSGIDVAVDGRAWS